MSDSHPVIAVLAAVSTAVQWPAYALDDPSDTSREGWTSCGEVLADRAYLDRWRERIQHELVVSHRSAPAVVAYVRVIESYLSVAGRLAAAAFVLTRRLPSLAPESMGFRLAEVGYPALVAVRLAERRFHCLPGDPAASHPDAIVVADEAALAVVLRERLAVHLDGVLAHPVSGVRLGRQQRGGLLTDVLEDAAWTAGTASSDLPAAARGAEALLGPAGAPLPPLVAASSLHEFTDALSRPQWARIRATCCYNFRLPGWRERLCFTCPRATEASRVQLAGHWGEHGPGR